MPGGAGAQSTAAQQFEQDQGEIGLLNERQALAPGQIRTGRDRIGRLGDDRSPIHGLVDEMQCGAEDASARGPGSLDRPHSGKSRQQGRMNVAAGNAAKQLRTYQSREVKEHGLRAELREMIACRARKSCSIRLAASANALPPADKITPNRVFLPLLTTNHT